VRIVVVEDELRIREGLARLISRIGGDYLVVGQASDGLEGERVVMETEPDLVITDVRMPDVDGLEMLERIRARGLRPKAIVLSAFSEFSYAREALRLGVREYLLKPVKVDELRRALAAVGEELEGERTSEPAAGEPALEGALYSIMVGGAEAGPAIRESLSGGYALVTVYLGRSYEAESERAIGLAEATLAERGGFRHRIVELPRGRRFCVFCFEVEEPEALGAWLGGRFLPRMREPGIAELCAGRSSFSELGELRATALGIDESLDWCLALGEESLVAWPEVEATEVLPLSYPADAESEARAALCSRDRPRYEASIAEFAHLVLEEGPHAPRDIKNAFIRFFWGVLGAARGLDYELFASLDQQELLESIRGAVSRPELAAATELLGSLFPAGPGREGGTAAASNSYLVARAKSVVREFFSQGITLNEVAAQVAVTPEYLSSRFHDETGVTFSAYIRDFRVQKAKELLVGSSLRLGEIGDRVGYRDGKYFCRVFKEATGMKPSDYRRANR
jgi:two-component system, response regulator YesN